MTVVCNHPSVLTVEWRGVEADGRGALSVSQLPNRLTAAHLRLPAAALEEAAECPEFKCRRFVFLFS